LNLIEDGRAAVKTRRGRGSPAAVAGLRIKEKDVCNYHYMVDDIHIALYLLYRLTCCCCCAPGTYIRYYIMTG
jgi:hypothetical protein